MDSPPPVVRQSTVDTADSLTPPPPSPSSVLSREELVLKKLSDLPTRYSRFTLNKLFYHIYSQLNLRHPTALLDPDKKIIIQVCHFVCRKLEEGFGSDSKYKRITALALMHRFQHLVASGWSADDRRMFDRLMEGQLQSEELIPLEKSLLTSLVGDVEYACETWYRPIGELFQLRAPASHDSRQKDGLDAKSKSSASDGTVFQSLEDVLAWVESAKPTLEDQHTYPEAGHELQLVPPPMFFRPDEFSWLDITNPAFHKPTIDPTVGLEPPAVDLLSKATQETLTIPERQTLLDALTSDPRLARSVRPQSIPQLVEYNPHIAIEALQRFNDHALELALEVLLGTQVSVHSLEVVNKLNAILPKGFLELYVHGCIHTCEGYTHDKYMQARLVRLVCVFLQSVIRTIELDMELYSEVTTFTLEFSRIKEAAGLYRQMKLNEGEQ